MENPVGLNGHGVQAIGFQGSTGVQGFRGSGVQGFRGVTIRVRGLGVYVEGFS